MINKPTYKELEQRVAALEAEAAKDKTVEEELRKSEEKYKKLVEMTHVIIYSTDNNGETTYVSPAGLTFLGYSPSDTIERKFADFVYKEDLMNATEGFQQILSGNLKPSEYRLVGKDRKIHWVRALSEPVFEGEKAVGIKGVLIDITDRKQTEEALWESEEEYRYLFNSLPDPVVIIKEDYTAEVNKATDLLLGYDFQSFENKLTVLDLVPPEYKETVRKRLKARFHGREVSPILYPFEVVTSEGKRIPCEGRGALIQYKGKPADLMVLRDITERKKAEEALEESEEQLRLAVEATQDGLWDWKINENEVLFSPRLKEMLGYEREEKIPASMDEWVSRVHSDHRNRFNHFEEDLKKTASFSVDFLLCTKNGEYRWFNSRSMVLRDEKGFPYRLIGSLRDITEEKQKEELIRKLTQSMITSQESERQVISRELHDSVAQDLSSSKIACDMLLKYKSLTPGARKKISEISGNLHKTLKSVRDLSYELRPPGLEKLGLAYTIRQLCKDFSNKTDVRVDFQSAGIDNLNLDYHTKINLYRLIQEGLNNVRKHADAKKVKLRLVSSFPKIILRINDDGKGFDLKERLATISSEKRMGLRSMEERVDLLQGKISIESSPGKGTKVYIEIPRLPNL